MARLTNDNLHGVTSIAPGRTVGKSAAANSRDDGMFDVMLKQVSTTADRADRRAEDASHCERKESDTRPADERKPAPAESDENESRPADSRPADSRPADSRPADEAPPSRSDAPEKEQGQDQQQEPLQGKGEERETDAGAEGGSEVSEAESEDDADQAVEGAGDEAAQVQMAPEPRQVLVEAVDRTAKADQENVDKASAGEEPARPDGESQAAAKTERRGGTTSKVDVSADGASAAKGERGKSEVESDAPGVELASDDSPEASAARAKNAGDKDTRQEIAAVKASPSGDPAETADQANGIELAASGVKASETAEKPSRGERRHGADQVRATGSTADGPPAVKAQGGSDAAAEILVAITELAETVTDQSGRELGDSGPKPIAGVVNQGEPGQPARASSDQGSRAVLGGEAAPGSETSQADRVRFVQRVASAFDAATSRNGSIRMRLHPAELGSLRLEITVRNGVMTARLETETQTAKNLLLENLPALRERLAQQEIKVQQFDIDLMDNSTGGSPREPADQSFSQDRSRQQMSGMAAEQSAEPEQVLKPRLTTRPGEGIYLNVVV